MIYFKKIKNGIKNLVLTYIFTYFYIFMLNQKPLNKYFYFYLILNIFAFFQYFSIFSKIKKLQQKSCIYLYFGHLFYLHLNLKTLL